VAELVTGYRWALGLMVLLSLLSLAMSLVGRRVNGPAEPLSDEAMAVDVTVDTPLSRPDTLERNSRSMIYSSIDLQLR
jgi:hypothetical protein